MIAFATRPKIEVRNEFRRRIWLSKDRAVRVVHSHCLLNGLSDVWYVERFDRGCQVWDVVTRHRRKNAAFVRARKEAS